jgi:hypothetical protein
MIPTRRAALAQSGGRFSKKIMRKQDVSPDFAVLKRRRML